MDADPSHTGGNFCHGCSPQIGAGIQHGSVDLDNHEPASRDSTNLFDDGDAIAMAQASIDRCIEGDVDDVDVDLDQLTSALELLGTLGVGPLADASQQDDRPVSLGRFQIIGERGRGGFGLVLRAFDTLLQREVALKLPHPERLIAGQSPEDFVREAQVAAGLEHEGIVRVYEVRRMGPVWYIASAFCDGPTLGKWLDDRPTSLAPRSAARLMTKIAEAVHFAHSRGILHLDLKPENILLDFEADSSAPRPMITDFGLASRSDAAASRTSSRIAGTLAYMAPEQSAGDSARIGVATDVFALGAVLREILAGPRGCRRATPSTSAAGPAPGKTTARSTDRVDKSGDLRAIWQKCMRDDPADRYDSARELAEDLHRYLRGECVIANPVAWPGRLLRTYRRRPAVAALATVLAVTILGSVIAMGALWRRAETNLARLERARQLRSQAASRMERSVLNLTWMAQERSILYSRNRVQYAAALPLLREFLGDVCNWSHGSAAGAYGLSAAAHSLALVQGMESLDDAAFEQEFHDGLESWLAVIKREPECSQWRRALAMYLLTHAIRQHHGDWLWWRASDAGLDAQAIELAEAPYAGLLIEYTQTYNGADETTISMLRAAVEILERRCRDVAPEGTCRPQLLIAYNRLAAAAALMSEPAVAAAHRDKADALVRAAPPASQCDPAFAAAVGDALQSSARQLIRERRAAESLPLLVQAAKYNARALAGDPLDVKLRRPLVAVHQLTATLQLASDKPAIARAALAKAIAVANEGLKADNGPRELIGVRARLYAKMADVWRTLGETANSQTALEQAARDFAAMNLRKQDARSMWLSSIECLQSLGNLYADGGRVDDGLEAYEKSLDLLADLKPRMRRHPQHAEYVRVAEVALTKLRAETVAAATP